jgi:hypothetical protein
VSQHAAAKSCVPLLLLLLLVVMLHLLHKTPWQLHV